MTALCSVCGWRTSCPDPTTCVTNRRNIDLYCRRYKKEPKPQFVRSVRHQGQDGKGDSSEHLVIVSADGEVLGHPPVLGPGYVLD